jgi:N-acetylglutamate synthase-like GNAT family acetyltransferase
VNAKSPSSDAAVIVPYEDRHRGAFRDLNLEWIAHWFTIEPEDRRLLDAPREAILAPGGRIWMVELGGRAVGCCALLAHGDGVYEVSKMAVSPGLRGGGIGRRLLDAVIDDARGIGARKLTIISNTVLDAAMQLYRSRGFREVPLNDTTYARGNIAFELAVDRPT